MPRPLTVPMFATAALLLTGCAADAQEIPEADTPSNSAAASPSATPSPTVTSSPELEALAALETAEETADGFTPEAFGAQWADVDNNGCDTFNDALSEYAVVAELAPNGRDLCEVFNATFYDPYLYEREDELLYYGLNLQRRDAVAVERYVSVADAWASGADAWGADRRVEYANDLATVTVVSQETAQARAGADASGWLPRDDAAACQWAGEQVRVKAQYDLTVDDLERESLESALAGC